LSLFYYVDDDLNSNTIPVKIEAGVTSTSVNITIQDDRVLEINEEFELIIVSDSLPVTLISGSPIVALVTIIDDDRKLKNCTPKQFMSRNNNSRLIKKKVLKQAGVVYNHINHSS